MDLRCPNCKNTKRFIGHQRLYTDVIVDSSGQWIGDPYDKIEIYEAENPYGPWTCTECGKVFDE
jgi:ribosomal protein S27E